jgi:hypothetical protein
VLLLLRMGVLHYNQRQSDVQRQGVSIFT